MGKLRPATDRGICTPTTSPVLKVVANKKNVTNKKAMSTMGVMSICGVFGRDTALNLMASVSLVHEELELQTVNNAKGDLIDGVGNALDLVVERIVKYNRKSRRSDA
jgi:hypothetical protein